MIDAEPARLAALPTQGDARQLILSRDTEIRLSTGYSRSLPQGSRWKPVGTLPQGTVYQRVDGVFSIEGRQVHEAYLVIKGAALLGFYLPGEARLSPLNPSVLLPLGAPS